MMRHILYILSPAIALGAGAALFFFKSPEEPPPQVRPAAAEAVHPPAAAVRPGRPVFRPQPGRESMQRKSPAPVQVNAPKKGAGPTTQAPDQKARVRTGWWEQQLRRLDRLEETLNSETDPARRRKLIQQLGAYVRVDTLRSLDWAMSLIDPQERRTALDSINRHALVGIGARIETDRTGFPKIRETTVMSAVAATGRVEPGDYITGMEDESGNVLSFEGLPAREIVHRLRGEAGSEVRLLMERAPEGEAPAYPFEVTVQRSLLVIQPPLK
jgi:C-terminal processing protease CtpA/Prc